jgi:hypothetical protein
MKRVNKCSLISRAWTQAEDFAKTLIAITSMENMPWMHRDGCSNKRVLPKWVLFAIGGLKIIDTSHFSSKIPPNMYSLFVLPRTRRPKPTSQEKVGSFLFG